MSVAWGQSLTFFRSEFGWDHVESDSLNKVERILTSFRRVV